MKYKGRKLEGRNTDYLVLIKGEEQVVFKAEALENYDEFNRLVPLPEPPERMLPGGIKQKHMEDPNFKKAMEAYAKKKSDYLIIKSLSVTEDLEWETVKINEPETWSSWSKELEESGFNEFERMRIMQLVVRVNSLDDSMLEDAKQRFLQETSQQRK